MRNVHRILAATALVASVVPTASAWAAQTIDFETTAAGTPTAAGNAVGSDYAAFGATFSDAFYKQCGGGCPAPEFGTFVSGSDFTSAFTVSFASAIDMFSFANVSNSGGTASAFDSGGNLLQSLDFAAYPGTFSFAVAGIKSVEFSGGPYGVDNFTFDVSAVPEPATWAMMTIGFGGIGGAMRRRKTTTQVRFA